MPDRPVRTLDDIDRQIVALLQQDGRLPLNDVAARVGVARSTAYTRFDRLRAEGVLTGFTATVDPAALGYSTAALILVNVDQRAWRSVREHLSALPGVEYVAATSGAFDFVVLVRVADVAALRDVVLGRLHALPEVRATQTVLVLDELHRPVAPAPARRFDHRTV